MTYYLAIDIGASSGRHILGYIENGKLKLLEVYRFVNNLILHHGSLVWDMDHLVSEVKAGIRKCGEIGKIPKTVAIDTWGVDYVLLDEKGSELPPVYSYRDKRTGTAVDKVKDRIPADWLYARTGIQKQNFNTIYQLYSDKLSGRLDRADSFLMIPAYLSYKLTGIKMNEYTNATTTGLVNAKSKSWDIEILDKLELPRHLFQSLSTPGTVIGDFTDEMQKYAGFSCTVVSAPSHDTASAVAACPLEGNDLYISSGTWNLIGVESEVPIINEGARQANFTNEGGINGRFRILKNYMGMWLLQNIRRDLKRSVSYDQMMEIAMHSRSFSYLDVNDSAFVAPENMIDAVKAYFNAQDMELPHILASVYHSLGRSYREALEEIEELTGKKIDTVHIVGGGCQDTYLNRLTAQYTGKTVTAGPVEATAAGNLVAQLIFDNACSDLHAARKLIKSSFDIAEVQL